MKNKNNSKKIIIEITKGKCRVNTNNCDEESLLIGMTAITKHCMNRFENVDKDIFKAFILKNIDILECERALKVIENSEKSNLKLCEEINY